VEATIFVEQNLRARILDAAARRNLRLESVSEKKKAAGEQRECFHESSSQTLKVRAASQCRITV
jgi:hypothetical protein